VSANVELVRSTYGAWERHVDRGEVTKLVHYWDRESALADVGLGTPPAAPTS
jgi:hypothetical protein